MTPRELNQHLIGMAESVVEYLLPNGHRQGNEYLVGSVQGEQGQSLRVCLAGSKAGVWKDFSDDRSGGDLLDLWQAVKGISFKDTLKQASDFGGVESPVSEFYPPKAVRYSKPDKKGVTGLDDPLLTFFKGRGISEKTVRVFKIAKKGNNIVFPYISPDGEVEHFKFRSMKEKKFFSSPGTAPCLFGWQAIDDNSRHVVITEGECFPANAEILTMSGWVRFDEYRGEKVAQYHKDESLSFIKPIAVIQKKYSGKLIRNEVKGWVSVTTPRHNLISKTRKGILRKHPAIKPISKSDSIPRCGKLDGEGIDLDNNQIALCLAVSADGSIDHRKCSGYNNIVPKERRYVRFGFKKKRKIERLRRILRDVGLEYSCSLMSNGCTSICFSLPEWVSGRILPVTWISDATLAQRDFILSELVHWDGNTVPNRNQTEYSSSMYVNAKWVQTIAHTAGIVSTIISRKNNFGKWFKVSLLHNKKTSSWQSVKQSEVEYDGVVYCVQVPTGMILVRQEDKITVSGNCDAMSYMEKGIPALSVPFGGGEGNKQNWIEYEFERLERFDTIYLSLDADQQGESAKQEIISRLGRHRCKVIELPYKDANEVLTSGITFSFSQALEDARTLDPEELLQLTSFHNDILSEFYPGENTDHGLMLPWKKSHGDVRCRPGDISVWAGVNSHGKSILLSNVVVDGVAQGYKFCVASMEMQARKLGRKMYQQVGGLDEPSELHTDKIKEFLNGSVWIFNTYGTARAKTILEVFDYARRRYGITHFIVDSLAKCGFAEDGYNDQKEFVDGLMEFSGKNNVHTHLVVHIRKKEDENKIPNKMDIKGTGAISDMVDNVFIVWRNKPKETALQGEDVTQIEKYQDKPDAILSCEKQRETGVEPFYGLWWHSKSCQFLEYSSNEAKRYIF